MFGSSVLNVHDARNYHPIKVFWEVQYKQGAVWIKVGSVRCVGDLTAVRFYLKQYPGKTVWHVRSEATLGVDAGPWRVIRFVSNSR